MIKTGSCPSCGAPVEYRWSSSVQTVCEYCRSILVRTDVNLEKVGQVADLPANASPIQIGTEGVYANRAFAVAGRIIYEYSQGNWNEWHLVFDDGTSGWLSDAQLAYDVSFREDGLQLPPAAGLKPGVLLQFGKLQFEVTTVTHARYAGVQGELPFQYWDKTEVPFVDIRAHDGHFGTLDYSEDTPLLFLGEAVEFDALKLRNLRSFEGWY